MRRTYRKSQLTQRKQIIQLYMMWLSIDKDQCLPRNYVFIAQCIYNEIGTHSSKRAAIHWLVCTHKGVHDLRGTAYTQHKLSCLPFLNTKKNLTYVFNNIKIELDQILSFSFNDNWKLYWLSSVTNNIQRRGCISWGELNQCFQVRCKFWIFAETHR